VAARPYTGVHLGHICWLHRPVLLGGGGRRREDGTVEHQDHTEFSVLNVFNRFSVNASMRGFAIERGGQNDSRWPTSSAVAR
jgi:hypothetical protein